MVQDFVNTRDLEADEDRLDSPAALGAWLTRWELLPADVRLDEETWRQALEVREILWTLIGVHGGTRLEVATVEALNRVLDEVRPRLRFDIDGALRLRCDDPGWPGALGRLILVVMEAMDAGRWKRLKICPNETCQQVFYDSSRNRSGKWCTVRKCGNRLNSKAYRLRGPTHLRGQPPIMMRDHRLLVPVWRPTAESAKAMRSPPPADARSRKKPRKPP